MYILLCVLISLYPDNDTLGFFFFIIRACSWCHGCTTAFKAYCTTLFPLFLDVPTFTTRCLHACNDARDPSSERWNCMGKKVPVILPKWRLPHHLGIFYMPQIYDMRLTAFLPLRRKACWGFFCPEKSWRLWPGLNPQTQVLKGSMLPLDHRSHHHFMVETHCNKLYE